tara:strand:- start:846 stop:1598 length:753 start_codon:yes stop_codon:yes gene_type:complete
MAGTDLKKVEPSRPGPAVVLVRPQMGENIGAAARAMKNFQLGELRLVAPRDGWPNERAYAMSSRADDILDAATVYDDTAAAVADLQLVYATTARRRDMEKPGMAPRQAAEEIAGRVAAGQRTGILFGGERAGLDNDDVVFARSLIHIPTNPGYASLNLGQAVLLLSYEYFLAVPATPQPDATAAPPATAGEQQIFFGRLEAELDRSGFLKPPEKRLSMVRNIRNLFQRAELTEQELRTLHGILSALIRRD